MANTNIYDPINKTYTAGTQTELDKAAKDIASRGASPIAVDTLTGDQKLIELPTTTPTTNVGDLTSSGNAQITSNNANIQSSTDNQKQEKSSSSLPDYMSSVLGQYENINTPNKSNIYGNLYSSSGIDSLQAKELASKQNLANLQAKLAGITAESKASQLSLEGQGRGIPLAVIGGQQAKIAKESAIKALPLQAEILAAQAVLSGDQASLQSAKDKLDTVYKIQSEDATTSYNQQIKLLDAAMSVASEKQKNELQAYKDNINYNQTERTDAVNNAQAIAKSLFDNQDPKTAAAITALPQPNIKSPTFASDLIEYNTKVSKLQEQGKTSNLDNEYKALQIQKLRQELLSTGTNNVDDLLAYAQQYSSTGTIPTGMPKGTFGSISELAKQLPKTNGEVIDINTGIKSAKLSPSQVDGYAAMKDLINKIGEAKDKFSQLNTGLIGGTVLNISPGTERQQYDVIKKEIIDLLSRARSGAALTETEIKTYEDKLPSTFNRTFWLGSNGATLLDSLKSSIENKLNTSLSSQGVVMYGVTPVKTIGDKIYKVGDVIVGKDGTQSRFNPDGSLTQIN